MHACKPRGVGGGMWRDQRVSMLLLKPVRKGVGESRTEKDTEVGVKRVVPSVPIRAATDGPKVLGEMGIGNNIVEERGA